MSAIPAYLLDTTATTKRNPAKSSGKISGAVAHLTGDTAVSLVAPQPMDGRTRQIYAIEAARRGWVTYGLAGVDIQAGDLITVSGAFTDAEVVAAVPWQSDFGFVEIIISE